MFYFDNGNILCTIFIVINIKKVIMLLVRYITQNVSHSKTCDQPNLKVQ